MAKVIFDGLTDKQAKTLAEWFEGQGEQDCSEWFAHRDTESPLTDVHRKGGYFTRQKNGDIVVHCFTPKRSN
jgi:hypothetical protein